MPYGPKTKLKPALIAKTSKIRNKNKEATILAAASGPALLNDLQPPLKIEHRDVNGLKPAANQVRKVSNARVTQLVNSIKCFGYNMPILVMGDAVVDGHARLAAMKALGEVTIPVIDMAHLGADQCRLLTIAMNRIAETGEWDLDALRIEIIQLEMLDLDLSVTTFSAEEVDSIKLDPEPEMASSLDEVPEHLTGGPVSQLGDMWGLGAHRLICGNSLDAQTYSMLLGEEVVQCVFTDGPYNCPIKGNVSGLGKVKHGEFVMGSGELTKAEFTDFNRAFLQNCRTHCCIGAVVFAFMDWRQYPVLVQAAEEVGLKSINLAVWDKGSGGMGSLYRSAHELIGVFCNGNTPKTNNVALGKNGRDRTNIWHHPGANKPGSSAAKMLDKHPTPKPVRLVADALLDVTLKGDIVLDPFMGSGTTIIACAETGRIARGIELDPRYVDVAVMRWCQASGEDAVLIETGETFGEVRSRRELAASAF